MYNDDEKKTENIGNESASSGKYDTPTDALNTPQSASGQSEQTASQQEVNASQPSDAAPGNTEVNTAPNTVQYTSNNSQRPGNPQQVPGGSTPSSQQPGKTMNPGGYYEPWQQPVYRAQGQTYSPGLNTHTTYQRSAPTPPPPPPPKKKKRTGGFAKAVCLVLVCVLASAGATYGVLQYDRYYGQDDQAVNQVVLGADASVTETAETETTDEAAAATSLTATGQEMSAEDIYAMAVEQVVGVNSETETNVFGQETTSAVSGTGFIISEDGYILTNYHVIEYAVNYGYTLTVMMYDGTSYAATVVGYEEDNDVAVIKIEAEGLNVVTIGDSEEMQVGDTIYAVGNPLGELDYTMTSGIVSALDRVIQVDSTTSINMFQIDAAVNSGNSGGPVYNAEGEVIGIVSAKYSSTGVEGLGFAIPISDAIDIATELITNGYVSGKPNLGISVRDWSSGNAQYYGTPEGALVQGVESGSAADNAGIQVGDIIIKLGDTEITSTETLLLAKKEYSAGDTTTIVVYRDGEELALSITFDEAGITSTASTTTTTTDQQKSQFQSGIEG